MNKQARDKRYGRRAGRWVEYDGELGENESIVDATLKQVQKARLFHIRNGTWPAESVARWRELIRDHPPWMDETCAQVERAIADHEAGVRIRRR